MSGPRIALVGARRVRQGLGPFVAAHLAAEGADVVGFLATSQASAEDAAADLARRKVFAPGYLDLDELLGHARPDALAILSPPQTHERLLERALAGGVHVLCEKPLIWGGEGLAERARELSAAFGERGLLLAENCQWPWVLPAFQELHPEARDEAPRSFHMRLTPASRGAQMIGDALPHPLSVLQALLPDPEADVADPGFSFPGDPGQEAEAVTLTFRYGAGTRWIACEVELIHGEHLPREASLTINGRPARRRVRLKDYALFLGCGDREVPLEDPLRGLLRTFVRGLRQTLAGRHPEPDLDIPRRMRMLERVLQAFRAEDPT